MPGQEIPEVGTGFRLVAILRGIEVCVVPSSTGLLEIETNRRLYLALPDEDDDVLTLSTNESNGAIVIEPTPGATATTLHVPGPDTIIAYGNMELVVGDEAVLRRAGVTLAYRADIR